MIIASAFAWAGFDADVAMASCGDYVMVGSAGHSHHTDHSLPAVPNCHGPHCQKHAPLPVGPTKGLIDAPPFDSAFWCSTACSASPSWSGLALEGAISLADGHAWPLLRPPSL